MERVEIESKLIEYIKERYNDIKELYDWKETREQFSDKYWTLKDIMFKIEELENDGKSSR